MARARTVPPAPPKASSANVRAIMQANRSKDTRPELALRSAVHRLGLRFRKHRRPISTLRCEADLVFPTERVAVFIDGCFWHGCAEHRQRPRTNEAYWEPKIEANIARDRRNDAQLSAAGWLVVRAWEHEEVEKVAARVAEAVRQRRELSARRQFPKSESS
jgi:DNA mismatch endonuclease (patch repair protein)